MQQNTLTSIKGFAAGALFAQQVDTLGALEELLGSRLYASQELAKLDDIIQAAFETAFPKLDEGETGPDCASINPASFAPTLQAITRLHQLLAKRKHATDEMARIDEAALPVLQRLGIALPPNIEPGLHVAQ